MARRRAQWRKYQGRLDPSRLVFIDETWAKTNMTRSHGRAPRGKRLVAKAPHGRWRTLTFLAALRRDRIDAPCVIDGPINGESFSPMSSRCSSRPSTPATSLSLSTSAATRVRPCAAPSKQPVPNYSSSRPIARSQPDRTSVCQAQKPAAQSCRTNRRSSRMRQLFRKRWIRVSLIRSRS